MCIANRIKVHFSFIHNTCIHIRRSTCWVGVTLKTLKAPPDDQLQNIAVKTIETSVNIQETSDYCTQTDVDTAKPGDQPKVEPTKDTPHDVKTHPSNVLKSSQTMFLAGRPQLFVRPSCHAVPEYTGPLQMLTATTLVLKEYITLPSPYRLFTDPGGGASCIPTKWDDEDYGTQLSHYVTPDSIRKVVEPQQAQ